VSRRVLVVLALLSFAFCVTAAVATAQRGPDCNLAERRFDNYLGDGKAGGFVAPRYVHHVVHLGLTVGVAELAHALLRTRAVPSTAIGGLTMQAPHLRDVAQGRPVGGADAVADAAIASLPLVVAIGRSGRSWQSTVLAVTSVAGLYLYASCRASP
jgi:hypothetical protein